MPSPLARHISALYSLCNAPLTYDVVRKRCRDLYQFAVWRGSHAVMALIQDDFDIQFGSEITAWIIECGEGDPLPDFPPHK